MSIVEFKAHKKADEGTAWDGAAARKRLLEWAGGENPDWGKYQQGFAWFDAEKKETQGAYKLPHSDIIDGDLCDVWKGVAAAMSALLGGRGGTDIPEDDRRGVYDHLAKHYKQFDKEPPEFRAALEEDEPQVLSTVRADLLAGESPQAGEVDAALAIINAKFAKKPLTPDQVYLLPPAEMSNQNIDSYFTRMHETSLRNYLQDALAGIPLMNSHRVGGWLTDAELPLGNSYSALLEQSQDNLRLVVRFYMLRGLELNDVKTDHLIRAIDGGIVRDTSIGFHPGQYVCGLCGKPLLTLDALMNIGDDADIEEQFCCDHVPGVTYDGQVAFAWVKNAHLVEGSLVYAGATPEAVLRQARWAVSTGRLARGEAEVLEDRWGVRILPAGKRWRAIRPGKRTGDQDREEVSGEVKTDEVRALVAERAPELADRVQAAEDPVTALLEAWVDARESRAQQETNQQARVVALEGHVAELEPLAADGRAYHGALVTQAVEARVRAQGDEFDAQAYRAMLEKQTLEYVRGEIAAWEKTAGEVFEPGRPVGKVMARDGSAPAAKGTQEPGRPAEAYKA